MAAIISLLVVVVFAVRSGSPGDAELRRGLPYIIGGYFTAGLAGGLGLWMLRRLPASLLAWSLRGMVVAFCVYGGAVGSLALLYSRTGINALGASSTAEAWRDAGGMALICAVVAGIPGGLWFRRGSARHEGDPGSPASERGTGGELPARTRGAGERISGGEAWRK